MKPLTILLADDHTIVRQGLRAILDAEPDLQVVGEVSDGREAVRRPRGGAGGEGAAAGGGGDGHRDAGAEWDRGDPSDRSRRTGRRRAGGAAGAPVATGAPVAPRVIILSMYADVEHVLHALGVGASGYVRKQDADAELVAAVRSGRPEKPFLTPSVDRDLLEAHRRRAEAQASREPEQYEPLTPREREVLQLVAEGRPNKQIASILGIAVRTVEAHRASIMRKLNITDQASLVRYAIRKGIVPIDE